MTNVLDVLRADLIIMHNKHDKSGVRDREKKAAGIREALAALDAFEAEHPGLVDKTQHCHWCGSPQPSDWQVSDGRFYRDCPDCAKSRKVQP